MRKLYWMIEFRKIRQFFKPTWRKLLIFAIMLLITIIHGLVTPTVVRCLIPSCPKSSWVRSPWNFCPVCSLTLIDYLMIFAYYAFFPINMFESYINSANFTFSFAMLTLQLLYWYFSSCIIVWVYSKFVRSKSISLD